MRLQLAFPAVLAIVAVLSTAGPALADCTGQTWSQSTLYMGRSLADGGTVGEDEVQAFVSDTIVPAFPDGFTIVDARGHWLDRGTGLGIGETTVMFVVAHPPSAESDAALQRVADAYIARFRQSAVLRSSHPVCVTFYEKK